MENNIRVVKLNPFAELPQKSTEHAVGWDIRACFYDLLDASSSTNEGVDEMLKEHKVLLPPFTPMALPTGLVFELPKDVEMAIKSRSGLFFRHGILAEGTIDPDYRGEVKIMLINLTQTPFEIAHGERIAQAVFRRVLNKEDLLLECQDISELSDTSRGQGGFGSTGVK